VTPRAAQFPVVAFVLVWLVAVPALGAAQAPAVSAPPAATQTVPPLCARTWDGRNAEFEEFIRSTPIERMEDVPVGVTKPKRAFFKADGLCGSIAWKVLPPGRPNGYWESYKSEVAAYELDKLLALNMVPPSVEKKWKGDIGAAILWMPTVRTWKTAQKEKTPPHWDVQAVRMKMFDNLIGNIDRNAGNLLIDAEWHLFLIDHSRAFTGARNLPFPMGRIDKDLWERMQALDEGTLTTVLGRWVDRGGIRAMLARRDKMQGAIDKLLQSRPAATVYIK
jgi:hypothetical protein